MDQDPSGWKTLLTRTNQLVRSATHPAAQLPVEGHLPSFDGATGWLNSPPLTAAGLRGRVVLVNFWTYTCINWLRTLPYVRAWAHKYQDQGLVVLGVHTPEFDFEHDLDNVRQQVKDPGPGWPPLDGCAAAGPLRGWCGGRSRPPAAPAGHVLDPAMAAARPQVVVQVGDRLGQAGVMGGQDRPSGGRVAQAVEDRDALGRPQHHIERRDGAAVMRAPQQLPGGGIPAREHGLEPRQRCFALQPQAAGVGAVPSAWGLAVAGQVLLVIGSQLTGVVGLPPHRELGDVGHHPAAPLLRPSLAPANAPVVHCSPRKRLRLRVAQEGD
jgi:thiol-disulfide isomerase/thioredoxin